MSEAIIKITEVDPEWPATVAFEVIASRNMATLWEVVGAEEVERLGLLGRDDEGFDSEAEVDGVRYAYYDGDWWTLGDQPEHTADGVQLEIAEALSDRDKTVGDLFVVDIRYEGEGIWEVTVEPTASAVFSEEVASQ